MTVGAAIDISINMPISIAVGRLLELCHVETEAKLGYRKR